MPTFSDIPEDHPYYDAIEWMAELGISIGYPDGTFRSDDPVSRGEMAVFLQRYDGAGPPLVEPIRQFVSGWGPGVTWSGGRFHGADSSGHDWDVLPVTLGWMSTQMDFYEPVGRGLGNTISIVDDPTDPTNRVVMLENTAKDSHPRSRSQWSMWQPTSLSDTGGVNLFNQQFYRFDMFIPSELQSAYSYSERAEWYMIWECHDWADEPGRYGIYVEKRANSDTWYFRHRHELYGEVVYENTAYPWDSNPSIPDSDFAVVFDEWFTVELCFKYHPTAGRWYMAVTDNTGRKVIGDYNGQTQYGNKMWNQTMFKMYHHGDYIDRMGATRQYYDNFEIWDAPPGDTK